MGVVYEALDRERNVRVALKTLLRSTPEALARFKREFRALEGLHHPNLVTLGELVSDGDEWFFTMELIEGVNFLNHVRPWYRIASSEGHDGELTTGVHSLRLLAAAAAHAKRPESEPAVPAASPAEPGAPRFDEEVLRDAFLQLARGLLALHDAHHVHRDVKPSNIRVTKEGRVVLLDFGLIREFEAERSLEVAGMAGTPMYMAPEQAHSSEVTAAADWYSFGTILYQCLTGRLPFEGAPPLQALKKKQASPPPAPSTLVTFLPEDLEALCMDLLAIDPGLRPSGREAIRRLEKGAPTSMPPASTSLVPPGSTLPPRHALIGRRDELAVLREAFAEASGEAQAFMVLGASGIGKTRLVRAFAESVLADDPNVLVLRGRCHEREAVPYKALDDVMDLLANRLTRLSAAEAGRLSPMHVGALLHVFPVLRRVKTFAEDAEHHTSARMLDPAELRRRAFAAARTLFTRLAERWRVLVLVDDLHWADADSFALLAALFRPPEAPPIFFVATARSSAEADARPAGAPHPLAARIPGGARELILGPLPDEDARALAAGLVASLGTPGEALAHELAAEGRGHPLFIAELAQAAHDGELSNVRTLDEALWARIARLPPTARAITELASVATAPLALGVLARAADMAPGELARVATMLRAGNLVRTAGTRERDRVEPYHDRVREAVLSRLDAPKKRAHHEALAKALETAESADEEALALHWREAGFPNMSLVHATAAAAQAWDALAFDRAAEWYAFALAVAPSSNEATHALRIRLGEALADAGSAAAAAVEFQGAAADEGTDAAQALALRRRAAEQLFRAGRYQAGLDVTAVVLRSLGLRLPRSPWNILFQLVFWRTVLRLRGLRYERRDPSRVTPEAFMRVDACLALATARGVIDAAMGGLFHTRALLLALDTGDPSRIATAMASELAHVAMGGGPTWKRTRAIMVRASEVAAEAGSQRAMAWVTAVSGFAYYMVGEFRRGYELMSRGEELLRATGARGFEVSRTRLFALTSLVQMGEIKQACARLPADLGEADEREDSYIAVNLRVGYANLTWLVADDPEGARRAIAHAVSVWNKSGFHAEHFYEMWSSVHIELYVGDAEEAARQLERRLPAYEKSFIPRLQGSRIRTWILRARCGLALARQGVRAEEHLAAVEGIVEKIEREGMAWADAHAVMLRGCVARMRRDEAGAKVKLRQAIGALEAADMKLEAQVARWCLGKVTGGAEGERMKSDAWGWMEREGVKRPEKLSGMISGGI
jgi:serine/threonine protein kinase